MDPSDYPFVRNGPDCTCHHARPRHVGWNERYEMRDYDVACQVPGCDCATYRPLGPLHYLALRLHERDELETIRATQAEATRRLRTRALVLLVASVGLSTGASVANHILGWTVLAVMLMVVSLAALVGYTVLFLRAVKGIGMPRLLTFALLLTLPILVLTALEALVVIPGSWTWISVLGLVGLTVVLVGIDQWRCQRRWKRVQQRMMQDMADYLVPPGWEPVAVISVRLAEPDEPQTSD